MSNEGTGNGRQLYRCRCKGTNRENGAPRHSLNWLTARRGVFRVFDDHVRCGNWHIPYADVKQATIYKARQLLLPVKVLELVTENETYQFGFNPWAHPDRHMNLDFEEKTVRLKGGLRSLLLAFLAVWIVFEVWRRLTAG
ncbi:MAG: hypothetical protein MI806_27715 [Minwuiales bacterium]|nr:hypothetical protein [Minwuiales bacterium]